MNLHALLPLVTLLALPTLAQAQSGAALPGTPLSACELGENIGVDVSDALVASRLVCGEVVGKARVAGKIPPASYRVNFGKLGTRVLMQVAEYGDGTHLSDERHVELGAIEDVSAIAKRVAESLVYKTPIADLENTENVLPGDAFERRQKQGRMHLELGLIGAMQVGSIDMAPKPGLQLGLTYELKRTYLGMAFRAAGADGAGLVDLGLGAGSYLSDADVAPFVGGGVSWMMSHHAPTNGGDATGSGFSPYAEVGLGVFRSSKTGLRVGLRASVPTYQLKARAYDAVTRTNSDQSSYVIPVVASVTMSF